jgi:hypothetical protein
MHGLLAFSIFLPEGHAQTHCLLGSRPDNQLSLKFKSLPEEQHFWYGDSMQNFSEVTGKKSKAYKSWASDSRSSQVGQIAVLH